MPLTHLNDYRRYPERWEALKCLQHEGSDLHEKERYRMLIALQYDYRLEDEAFVRFLFTEEVIARENDLFQGIGESLILGAYLLARAKNPEDIPLFYRAKQANFDTYSGFDLEFAYYALKEATEPYLKTHHSELYEALQGTYETRRLASRLERWWKRVEARYPDSLSLEPLNTRFERAIYFEAWDEAKALLEQWNAQEPESAQKQDHLIHGYIALKEYTIALEISQHQCASLKDPWERASAYHNLLKLYTKSGAPKEGLDALKAIDCAFKDFDSWKAVGLGRMAIHEAFCFALETPELATALQAFEIGDRWFCEIDYLMYVGLDTGAKAASRCGFEAKATTYAHLAQQEKA